MKTLNELVEDAYTNYREWEQYSLAKASEQYPDANTVCDANYMTEVLENIYNLLHDIQTHLWRDAYGNYHITKVEK